jgi:hypothetical protein
VNAFRESRSNTYAIGLFEVKRTYLRCRIIIENDTTKSKGGQLYSPLATIITQLCELTVYVFDHWISGNWENVIPLETSMQHFGLANNQNRKHTRFEEGSHLSIMAWG